MGDQCWLVKTEVLFVLAHHTLFFTRQPRQPCDSRATAPYFLHDSRDSRLFSSKKKNYFFFLGKRKAVVAVV